MRDYLAPLDWFIHDRLRHSEILATRARNIAGAAFIAAVVMPAYAIFYYHLNHHAGALAITIAGIVVAVSLALLKFTGRFVLCCELFLTSIYLLLLYLSYSQGGVISPSSYWLVLMPIMATFLVSMANGFIWVLISSIGAIFLYILQIKHVPLPHTPINNVLLLEMVSVVSLTCVIFAFIYIFKLTKMKGFKHYEEAVRIIEQKSNELEKANLQLHELATKNQAILTAVVDGIITVDLEGNIIICNRAASEIFGYQNDEISKISIHKLFENKIDLEFFVLQPSASHYSKIYELTGVRKDNSTFPLELAVSSLELAKNKIIILTIRDITERKNTEKKLVSLAHYDNLTCLPNRALYEILLTKALEKARQEQRQVALIYFDLDYFKDINDSLGHDIGDLLLKEVAARISNRIRKGDILSRLGGDEFTVIIEGLSDAEGIAAKVAQMILHSLKQPFLLNNFEVYTNASIGIALYPDNGTDVTTLTKNADMAMYNAKENGRSNYQFFSHELNKKNLTRINLEKNLREALISEEFHLNYQPQFDTKTNEMIGMEALLRWNNKLLGAVPPDQFIPVAERIGLIPSIGEWVITNACKQLKFWQEKGLLDKHVKMAINVSNIQLKQEGLVHVIKDTIKLLELDPTNIELELTESTIMQDKIRGVAILQQLSQLGVSITIDDFGTGYSSLSYLKCLPIHQLKIDKSFISDLLVDKNDASIVKAIIALGHSLDLKIIAEGVENKEQLLFLRENNCDAIQGYFTSRPLDADELVIHFAAKKQEKN